MSRKIHFEIGGMTCIHCQTTIENALRTKHGVISAVVSYKKGTADVVYDDEKTSLKKLVNTIEGLEYKVLTTGEKESTDLVRAAGLLLIIAFLFYLLQSFGILNRLVPNKLADTGMGYGMLFVIGLLTSVHCIAMCGGIGLSQSLLQKKGNENSKSGLQTFLNPLAYNLGRVCSYTVIGLVLGTVGSLIGGGAEIGVPSMLQGVLKIVAGLLMVVMGINMLGIFPWLRRFTIHPPVAVAKFIGSKSATAKGPFIVGLLNGLMPCGPLQAMWIVALASANPFAGALSMFMFSMGTVPLMLGMGSAASLLGKKFTKQVMSVGAVIVAVMGLAMLTQGAALSGFYPLAGIDGQVSNENNVQQSYAEKQTSDDKQVDSGAGVGTESSSNADDVQIVTSTLALGSYPDITVKAGVPVRWTIDVPETSINGCNAVMVIQDYNIMHQFDVGENVIEFTPTEAGLVRYSCWMGMVYGSINVVE